MDKLAHLKLKAILSKGYFPKELPIAFATSSFGANSYAIIQDWKKSGTFKYKPSPKFQAKKKKKSFLYDGIFPTESEVISKPKKGFERRAVHVTHPLPQALLSYEICSNWNSIQSSLSLQTFSSDEIVISDAYERSIKGINFSLHRRKKLFIEATTDWLVKTDITRFYPTIYTHSIAWAMYGKENVKSAMKAYGGSLADRLDILVRLCNRNQTVGIPIGPETSRIIAELISSRIDAELAARRPELIAEKVDRLQDDWFVGLASLESAERLISDISYVYKSFGLEINGSKTSIARFNEIDTQLWVMEVGAFLSHKGGYMTGARLREFLSLAVRLQKSYPTEPVINYCLSVVERQSFAADDVTEIESFLLKAAVLSPISLDRICYILINLDASGAEISRKRIKDRFLSLASVYMDKDFTYELIWILYILRGLKININSIEGRAISEYCGHMSSSVVAIILMDMRQKGLMSATLPQSYWESKGTEDAVSTEWSWLLSYEGIRNGWLGDPKSIMAGPLFDPLAKRHVYFFDKERNVKTIKGVVNKRNAQLKEQNLETAKLLMNLRGFKWSASL